MDLLNYTRFSRIFISTILIASFFFWETDYLNLNFRYFFLLLIIYNFINFSKSDFKIYLYILCIPIIIYIHSILSLESKLLNNRYYLSLIFASLLLLIISKNYNIIVKNITQLLVIYITLVNIIGLLTIFLSDEKLLFDRSNLEFAHNSLCTIFNQNNFFIFRKIFFEPSHFAFINNSVLVYLFIKYRGLKIESPIYSINLIFFIFFSLVFFIAATTFFGIIFSMIFLLAIMWKKLDKNIVKRALYLIFICLFISISVETCINRILQLSQINNLYNKIDIDREIDTKEKSNFFTNIINDVIEEKINNNDNKAYNTVNFSTAVQGHSFMLAISTLLEKPFGYGFQNYQYSFDKFNEKINFHIDRDTFITYNYNDGASIFNKSIVEFGLLNLLFFLLMIVALKKNRDIYVNIFFLTAIITQLIRGAGYFNGSFLIIYLLMIFYNFEKK